MAKLSAKDEAIINANVGVSHHDLLTLHGLSEKGYNTLVEMAAEQAERNMNAKKPVLPPVTKHILQPTLDAPAPVFTGGDAMARLIPKSGGLGTLMSRKQAEKMASRYPTQYRVS